MIENLQAIVAVVEAQSMTKAWARLCVTQSAVSRRLQQLEETLGASLFDRTQRPPAPTALGLRVYEHALPILRAVEDLVAMTKEKADPIGILRLGMAQGIGDLVLAEAVERLQKCFPEARPAFAHRLESVALPAGGGWGPGCCACALAGIVATPRGAHRAFHRLPSDRDRPGRSSTTVSAADPARASCQARVGAQPARVRLPCRP